MEESEAVDPTPEAPPERSENSSAARPETKADLVYGAVVGTLYILAVGVQVFLVVDEVTHGALSAQVGAWWREVTAQWRERRRIETVFRAQAPWVVWDAVQLVDEARNDERGEP